MSSALTKLVKEKTKQDNPKSLSGRVKRICSTKTFQIYFFSFLIPFLVLGIVAIADHIYPFGTKCFLRTDLYNQYLPFFAELQRKIESGENLFYSWNLGIGADFMAVFAYYLASPMNILITLVSTVHLIELMTMMIFIKIALCGVSFSYFLIHHFHQKRYSMICFSVFYALSGFMAAYNWDIMWLDSVFLAPLIIAGLEALILEKKWKLYTITLGLSILINYYMSIMICIFLVLYFIIQILYIPWKQKGRSFLMFAGCSILAGLLASIVLIPGALGIFGTGFAKSDFPDEVKVYFNALDVISRHCVNVSTEIKNDHWPNIYCGVGVLFLLPLYISSTHISWKKKIPNILLVAFFIASFSINVLNFIWHGMNYPDSLPARQSFLYILFVLMLCYEAFLHVEETPKIQLSLCYLVSVAIVVCSYFFTTNAEDFTGNNAFVLTIMFLTVYTIFGAAYLKKAVDTKLLILLLTAFVAFETGIDTYNTSFSTVTRSKYVAKYTTNRDITQELAKQDSSFYRVEQVNRMTKNDAPLSGFRSSSLFSSTIESGVENFYKEMGLDYSKVYYCYSGVTPLSSGMLGVKYLISDAETDWTDSFHTLKSTEGDSTVYQNVGALSIGYAVPGDLEDHWDYTDGTAIQTQNSLGRALGVSQDLFQEIDTQTIENLTTVSTQESGTIYVQLTGATKDNGDKIDVTVTAPDGTVRRTKTYGDARKGILLSLGYCEAGDNVTLSTQTGSMSEVIVSAYRMNDDAMKQALDALGKEQLQVTQVGASSLKGTITTTGDKELVISVPYDKGWSIYVDGVKQEVGKFAGAFPSVSLTAGTHEITMNYVPVGAYEGMAMTAAGLAILIFLLYLDKKRKISRR